MKRPWQVWSLFGLCLAVVVSAMGYLTFTAIRLDRAEMEARQQAALEEEVRLALWQMDSLAGAIVTEEAARPFAAYLPFRDGATGGKDVEKSAAWRSPLTDNLPAHALLYFQCDADGRWTSPQCVGRPADALESPDDPCAENARRLDELRNQTDFAALAALLPDPDQLDWGPGGVGSAPEDAVAQVPGEPLSERNYLGLEQLDEQLENQVAQNAPEQQEQQSLQQQFAPNLYANGLQGQQRGSREFQNRNRAFNDVRQQAVANQRLNTPAMPPPTVAAEGVGRPVWIGDRLLLIRRVVAADRMWVQGCWLNWPRLESRLLDELSDRLPKARLVPVAPDAPPEAIDPGRMLATLPVRLEVSAPTIGATPLSPIRLALLSAWGCMILVAAAIAGLLLGVVSLSERRGAFVSAVTHEMRTPLTTFRMYAEMLAEDMVADPDRRKEYLHTLGVEADRLSHLVENVLSYAQLERNRRGGRREVIRLEDLIDRMTGRLCELASRAEMRLEVDLDDRAGETSVHTDPAAVEQILFNLVDNACKYAASADDRRLLLEVRTGGRHATIRVRDHGPGISSAEVQRLFRPFSKSAEEAAVSAPGVGLGLALCRRLARKLGGRLQWEQPNGPGAAFLLTLPVAKRA